MITEDQRIIERVCSIHLRLRERGEAREVDFTIDDPFVPLVDLVVVYGQGNLAWQFIGTRNCILRDNFSKVVCQIDLFQIRLENLDGVWDHVKQGRFGGHLKPPFISLLVNGHLLQNTLYLDVLARVCRRRLPKVERVYWN